jgi:hypothetical protein
MKDNLSIIENFYALEEEKNTPSLESSEVSEDFKNNFINNLKKNKKTKEQLEVEEVSWSTTDSLATAQRFFSSAALGWGDELGLLVAAGVASLQTGEPTGEILFKMRQQYDKNQEEFNERFQGAALAADIAGSVASPLNFIAGPASVTSRLSQLQGVTGTAARTGALTGRAGAEGAIYGAGEADLDGLMQGASEGAMFGAGGAAVGKAVTGAAGGSLNLLTRRKIEGDLIDENGDFVPITLAAKNAGGVEGMIHALYRDVIAPSFGGKGIIKAQEEIQLGKKHELIDEHNKFIEDLKEGATVAQKSVDEQLSEANKKINAKIKEIDTTSKKEQASLAKRLKRLGETQESEVIIKDALKQTGAMIDAKNLAFRNKVFLEALPESTPPAQIKEYLSLSSAQERMKFLNDLWRDNGYSVLKNRNFALNINDLQRRALAALKENQVVGNTQKLTKDIEEVWESLLEGKGGVYSGQKIATFRSYLGTLASDVMEKDPNMFRALKTIQKEVESALKKQLSPEEIKRYDAEQAAYRVNSVLINVMDSTFTTKRGAFTGEDWLAGIKSNRSQDLRTGTGPLNKDAVKLAEEKNSIEKRIARNATAVAQKRAFKVEAEMKAEAKKLKSEINKYEKLRAIKEKQIRVDSNAANEVASSRQLIIQKEAELKTLEDELRILSELRSPKMPSWFHTLAATGIMYGGVGALLTLLSGGGFAAATGAAGLGTAAAIGGGRLLSKPSAQMYIAGQSPGQQAAQEFLARDSTGRTAEILQRAAGRAGVGMLTQ